MNWGVASAKQQLSRLLKAARQTPQIIRTRGELVAAVLGAEDAAAYLALRAKRERAGGTLSQLFADARRIAAEERVTLPAAVRRDRPNSFARRPSRARRHERRP